MPEEHRNLFNENGGLSLFTLHGATYLGLKTEGDVRERAQRDRSAPGAGHLRHRDRVPRLDLPDGAHDAPRGTRASAAARSSACWSSRRSAGWCASKLEGWAFIATAVVIVAFFSTLFLNLYPNVLVSSVSTHYDLTIVASASHRYTLEVMSWVALIFTPLVLLYQSWTYWIFKKRVSRPGEASEAPRSATNV